MFSFKVLFCFILSIFLVNADGDFKPTFRYLTSYDKNGGRFLTSDDIQKTTINVLKQTIFIVNGIKDRSWYDQLTNEYFQKDNYNIIIVEWDIVEDGKGTEVLGTALGDFIVALLNKTEERYLEFHLLGVAQGAQVSNVAGRHVAELSGRNVNRITALEPINYLINKETPSNDSETSNKYANFVDAVHSDVVNFNQPYGDIDFYVTSQVQCNKNDDSCSLRAIKYYSQSINTSKFQGVKCTSLENFKAGQCEKDKVVVFGENVDKNARGSYFLQADDKFDLIQN